VVIVVNKIDLVTAAEQSQVCSFVREHARAAMLLPAAPLAVSAAATVDDLPLFATSARAGVAARSQPADVAQRCVPPAAASDRCLTRWAASGRPVACARSRRSLSAR
jgi:G3E family GTPase